MKSQQLAVHIVGVNISKQDAHLAYKRGDVMRIAHGVYFSTGQASFTLLQAVGIRLAKYFFPLSALTHASAWHKTLINNSVFVGGDYPYKKQIVLENSELRIMQSMVHPQLNNPLLYTAHDFHDPLGHFTMHCATPELVAIQQMDATKQNRDKHLDSDEEAQLFSCLLAKYGDRIALLSALEQVAAAADRRSQFERLLKGFFLQRFT